VPERRMPNQLATQNRCWNGVPVGF